MTSPTSQAIDSVRESVSFDRLYVLRTASYDKNATGCNPCEICGREVEAGTGSLVVTDQGSYPVGPTCIRKARKAGLPIVADFR